MFVLVVYLLSLLVRDVMFLQHRHVVLQVLDDVRRRLVGLAKGERHGGELPWSTKQRVHSPAYPQRREKRYQQLKGIMKERDPQRRTKPNFVTEVVQTALVLTQRAQ